MTTFDGHQYEQEQYRQQHDVADKLRVLPAFRQRIDSWGRGPAVMLQCTKGHRLLAIMAEDLDDRIMLRTVSDHRVRSSGAVTFYAEVWRNSKRVCAESGCPELVQYDGTCEAHGSKQMEEIGSVRTGFLCRQCKKPVGVVTTARLLKLYILALTLGVESVPIGDTPQRRS